MTCDARCWCMAAGFTISSSVRRASGAIALESDTRSSAGIRSSVRISITRLVTSAQLKLALDWYRGLGSALGT